MLLLGNVDSEKLIQAPSPYVSQRRPDGHLRPGYSDHPGVGRSPLASDPATSLAHGEVVSDSEVLGQLLCPSYAFTTVHTEWDQIARQLWDSSWGTVCGCSHRLHESGRLRGQVGLTPSCTLLTRLCTLAGGLVSVHSEQGHLFNRCVKYPKPNIFSQIHDAYWTMVPISPSIHFINC